MPASPPVLVDAVAVRELASRLDARLEERRRSPKQAGALAAEDVALAPALAATAAAELKLPPEQSDPALLQAALHSLACLAAWDCATCRKCLEAGCVEPAGRAAVPALPGDLPLPAGVAHVALMLLVNLSVYEEGAQRVAKTSNFLQTIAEAAEDVRCRSLARSVLDNVAHHAGLLTQLTTLRTLPKTLQKVNPRHMLATFAQLESGCTG